MPLLNEALINHEKTLKPERSQAAQSKSVTQEDAAERVHMDAAQTPDVLSRVRRLQAH